MEFRVNSESIASYGKIVEVCIDDQWHEASSTTRVANNTQSPQNISVVIADSTSMTIEWSTGQSIPNDSKIISRYDLSCTTSDSGLSDGQIYEVRVPNISTSTTEIQVHGLIPDMAYECCVNAHIHTNTPLDLLSSRCITTRTEFVSTEPEITTLSTGPETDSVMLSTTTEFVSTHNTYSLAIGLGTGLSIAFLLLIMMGSIILNIILIIRLRNRTATNFKPACTNK